MSEQEAGDAQRPDDELEDAAPTPSAEPIPAVIDVDPEVPLPGTEDRPARRET